MTQAKFFPVAGCAGTDHRLAGDYHHRWMVIDAQGEWLTAQACPALQEVSVDLKMGALVLRAPGMLRMDIPLDVIEDDDSVTARPRLLNSRLLSLTRVRWLRCGLAKHLVRLADLSKFIPTPKRLSGLLCNARTD